MNTSMLLYQKAEKVDMILKKDIDILPIKVKPKIDTPFVIYLFDGIHIKGEFTCTDIYKKDIYDTYRTFYDGWMLTPFMSTDGNILSDGLSNIERYDMYAHNNQLYGLKIMNPVIYDAPKTIAEFKCVKKSPVLWQYIKGEKENELI